jgi:hypothetical protein
MGMGAACEPNVDRAQPYRHVMARAVADRQMTRRGSEGASFCGGQDFISEAGTSSMSWSV